MGSEFK